MSNHSLIVGQFYGLGELLARNRILVGISFAGVIFVGGPFIIFN
ncbi:MAG: hypothetical protein RID07_12975 [Lacipirellulaceae bacterium]